MNGEYGEFINIEEEDEKYFHIYFNDNKKNEITSLNIVDNVSKILIIKLNHFQNYFLFVGMLNPLNLKNFTEKM